MDRRFFYKLVFQTKFIFTCFQSELHAFFFGKMQVFVQFPWNSLKLSIYNEIQIFFKSLKKNSIDQISFDWIYQIHF